MNRKYTDEERAFFREFVPGHSHKEITTAFNKRFKPIKQSQVKSYIKNNKLNTGKTGRFEKGHVPANKGKKTGGGPLHTRFKKGNSPVNQLQVGAEIKRDDGYLWVKIAEPNVWKQKHRILWEREHGPMPENHALLFLDGDRNNICIENLALVSRNKLLTMNRKDLIKTHKELTETGMILADLIMATTKRKKNC